MRAALVFAGLESVVLATVDSSATRIILLGTALTVVLAVARSVWKFVKRLVKLTAALEELPDWMSEQEGAREAIQAEVVRAHQHQAVIENGQRALLRELGIEDRVRRIDPRVYGIEDLDADLS